MSLLNSKAKNFLVLDFGSGFVKGFCLQKNKDGLVIQKTAEQPIKFFSIFDVSSQNKKESALLPQDFYLEIIEKAARQTLTDLGPDLVKGASLIIGLPANCLKARVAGLPFQRSKERKKISANEAKAIYQQVFQEAKNQVLLELKQSGEAMPQEIKVLRTRALEAKISGYSVPNIAGFSGQDLHFQILTIFLNNTVWSDFQKIITRLGFKNYQIHHTVEGLIKIQGLVKKEQAVFVAVGARFTQLFGFRGGILETATEFEAGGMELTMALQEKLKISEAQAEEIKLGFAAKTLTPRVNEKIKSIFEPSVGHWLKSFQDKLALARFANAPILFIGGGCLLTELQSRQGNVAYDSVTASVVFRASSLNISELPLVNPHQIKLSSHHIEPILLGLVDDVS